MNELNGFVKVIADGQGVIIGAQIIGPHASDLIHEFALAAQNRLTIADVASTIHAHPTLSEAIWRQLRIWRIEQYINSCFICSLFNSGF